jgi:hypothetical protein
MCIALFGKWYSGEIIEIQFCRFKLSGENMSFLPLLSNPPKLTIDETFKIENKSPNVSQNYEKPFSPRLKKPP